MKQHKLKFLILSLPLATAMFPYSMAHAALRVNNSSVVKSQMQNMALVHEMASVAQTQTAPQPARTVTDANGNTTTISDAQMDACNAIYPGGTFDWGKPTMGMRAGGAATCASYVELRAYNGGGTSYNVLATGYLSAGDAVRCNIDSFPDITVAGRDFTYPADEAPTVEDVEKVMAEENKSNAGFKILATAVVGGIGGNLIGRGDDGFGTNPEKLKSTAVGALGGAALMTASTQVNDYKAGSMILSTGTNMAAGAVAGNVMASGDEVLQIDNCPKDMEHSGKCLYGTVATKKGDKLESVAGKDWYFWDYENDNIYRCSQANDKDPKDTEFKNCVRIQATITGLADVSDDVCKTGADNNKKFDATQCKEEIKKKASSSETTKYGYGKNDKNKILKKQDYGGTWVKITSAETAGSRTGAVVKLSGEYKNIFGYKREDWRNSKITTVDDAVYDLYGKPIAGKKISDFNPAYKTASDGGVIDFNNAARTKSTLIGAGAGGALGALSGAAGADAAINERYLTALREYEDSLANIVCYTGARYLAKYNDTIIVPEMKNSD